MNGEWTFAASRDDWTHESFPTKEVAINEGKLTLEGSFFIGQLIDRGSIQWVENIEEIGN